MAAQERLSIFYAGNILSVFFKAFILIATQHSALKVKVNRIKHILGKRVQL